MNQERLKELVKYDPVNGEFHSLRTGKQYSRFNPEGYLNIFLDGHYYRGGRLAWLYVFGEWPPELVDHINGKRGDDRIVNLRLASRSENAANARGKRRRALPKGVCFSPRKDRISRPYRAQIMCKGVAYCLGWHETVTKAKSARCRG